MKYILIPNKKISHFEIGKPISNYLGTFTYKFEKRGEEIGWDTYYFFDEDIEISVDKESKCIESIGCRKNCYLQDLNLIGLRFDLFLKTIDKNNLDLVSEEVWMNDEEKQTVYDLDDLFLQIWVNDKGLIESVFLLNLS